MKKFLIIGFLGFIAGRCDASCDSLQSKRVVCHELDSTGRIAAIKRFKKGTRVGTWIWFEPNGRKRKEVHYKKGEVTWTKDYYPDNRVRLTTRSGKVKWMTDCGCK